MTKITQVITGPGSHRVVYKFICFSVWLWIPCQK